MEERNRHCWGVGSERGLEGPDGILTRAREPKRARGGVDWGTVEGDYRAGILTVRQIAKLHGCSHTAVRKRAKREGWTRDLAGRIRAEAAAQVARDASSSFQVSRAVSTETATKELGTDADIVRANAELQADVIREHRTGLRKSREIVANLLRELELTGDNVELLRQLGILVTAEDKDGKRFEAFSKALSLGTRADTVKKLVEALRSLVTMERTVFGIEAGESEKSYEERLRELMEGGSVCPTPRGAGG